MFPQPVVTVICSSRVACFARDIVLLDLDSSDSQIDIVAFEVR